MKRIDLEKQYRAEMFHKLKDHVGHEIECVLYGEVNVAIECIQCGTTLVDVDSTEEEQESA